MTKLKALNVWRVMEPFKKGEDDPVVWMSIFMKKERNGNLNVEECKTPPKADVPMESSKDLPPIDLEKVISDVPQEMKGEYVGFLGEFRDLWSRGRFDLGELKVGGKPYEATIPTETSVPIR
uniref:Uncharacterized protein n=1 Tax=Chromera velia CCMP2878 TaxID=1169474 RepID=A0A0G4HBT4_9ALVE|eukprot:Cvel_6245.t1-p1 / transcript=Cvel_6245.t1 / gene=Cvel_6245 / organism=Chromera_velia_CCMP2878 / gene_product=hypothetical protein / transcript_product=hypothetical protein / location=Cvel_scaffold302:57783-59152(+) / protein_length=121 / sequence_SO=supercontig / SO=protein_coding / is_pseudo=false